MVSELTLVLQLGTAGTEGSRVNTPVPGGQLQCGGDCEFVCEMERRARSASEWVTRHFLALGTKDGRKIKQATNLEVWIRSRARRIERDWAR